DVVYMTCENPDHDFEFCQPQIVPIFGGSDRFDNTTAYGSLTVSNTVEAYEQYDYNGTIVSGGDLDSEAVVVADWMRPRYLDVDAILAGTPFEANLVAGASLIKVGTYTVSLTEDGGLLVELAYDHDITPDTATVVVFGNINIGKSHLDASNADAINDIGIYLASIGDSIIIPAGDVAALADGGWQYFFLCSGINTQSALVDVSDQYVDVEFDFIVLDSNGVTVAGFSLKDGENQTVSNLSQGEYTVVETTTGWTVTYSITNGKVAILPGEDTTVMVTNQLIVGTFMVV
ncbi:MAG: hypothetical protein FWH51_06315, partial [Dehalococcoidia bacterium]|nr:hypothetical protein [Dehalococcoidia bacterium]